MQRDLGGWIHRLLDRYRGDAAVHAFGVLNAAISGALVLAPTIGATLVAWFGWRSTFLFISLLSVVGLFFAAGVLPEISALRTRQSVASVARSDCEVAVSARFLAYALRRA